ncbi:DUF4129 domain-containing protein [Roseibium aggregatum]|uniref:DUF4129 domain-containing protein n=1 Tax=Roseibium aggregatum TaxID=187304 RepID=A0A939EHN9_9HYPH|nr:DUF4129 domain-containing protein [Roseibium aggregatum]MBN9673382.1 DUF4129 domain-containing protein [Roseibium aggregatum]
MFRLFVLFPVFLILGIPAQASAQEAVREPLEIGESGTAYLRSTRLRGIDSDVAYFDPTAPAPDLKTEQQPQKRPGEDDESEDGSPDTPRWIAGLIAATILAALAYVVLRFGGTIAVSLRSDAQNPGSGRHRPDIEAPAWASKLSSFDEILRMKDRRRALVLLTQKALAATVTANGILMQRSWTARDALRHIPEKQNRLDLLRTLVFRAERVQFGDRGVTEDEFQDHAARCRELLGHDAMKPGVA